MAGFYIGMNKKLAMTFLPTDTGANLAAGLHASHMTQFCSGGFVVWSSSPFDSRERSGNTATHQMYRIWTLPQQVGKL